MHHQAIFKELTTQVSMIEVALKKYEKKVTGALPSLVTCTALPVALAFADFYGIVVGPTLEKVSEALTSFYAEENGNDNAQKFAKAYSASELATESFIAEMLKAKEEIDAYLERLNHMRKMLAEHEKAHVKMKDKEKEAQKILNDTKADRKASEKANEKATYLPPLVEN